MGINNVRHPIKDTVRADNSTYSSNKIEALVQSARDLPAVTSEDAGDVLMVSEEGEWGKNPINKLPDPGALGDFLRVASDGEWHSAGYIPASQLPAVTSSDEGKVLTVDSNGDWGAEMPQASSVAVYDIDSNGNLLNGVTFETINTDIAAGKDVIIHSSTLAIYYRLVGWDNKAASKLTFMSCYAADNSADKIAFSILYNRGYSASGNKFTIKTYSFAIAT